MTADPRATADYIAARADESLSYDDIAYAESQGWCPSSPDGMGPHRPDDTTDPLTCAECGQDLTDLLPPTEAAMQAGMPGQVRGLEPPMSEAALLAFLAYMDGRGIAVTEGDLALQLEIAAYLEGTEA